MRLFAIGRGWRTIQFDGKRASTVTETTTPAGVVLTPEPGPKRPYEPLNAGQLQALIHLYRAEVGRMVTYRQRLDTTTNWSITSSALVATFSLGNPMIPHHA